MEDRFLGETRSSAGTDAIARVQDSGVGFLGNAGIQVPRELVNIAKREFCRRSFFLSKRRATDYDRLLSPDSDTIDHRQEFRNEGTRRPAEHHWTLLQDSKHRVNISWLWNSVEWRSIFNCITILSSRTRQSSKVLVLSSSPLANRAVQLYQRSSLVLWIIIFFTTSEVRRRKTSCCVTAGPGKKARSFRMNPGVTFGGTKDTLVLVAGRP